MSTHPADTLVAEHRLIAAMVDALDTYADFLDSGGAFDRDIAGEFVAIIRDFADGVHHRKEEDLLFPALSALGGFTPEMAMREDHELGRELIGDMTFAIESGERATAHELFSHAASRYVRLKRAHVEKENGTLLPAARAALTGERADSVLAGFAGVADRGGWEARIAALAERVRAAAA